MRSRHDVTRTLAAATAPDVSAHDRPRRRVITCAATVTLSASSLLTLCRPGVILYILLCGFPPFYEEELPALFDSILNARYDFPSPWWDNVSDGAKGLVRKLLELDPKKRLTAEQVLKEEWIINPTGTVLTGAKNQLKKYNASRKLRKAALGIIAQQRMERALRDLRLKQQPA